MYNDRDHISASGIYLLNDNWRSELFKWAYFDHQTRRA